MLRNLIPCFVDGSLRTINVALTQYFIYNFLRSIYSHYRILFLNVVAMEKTLRIRVTRFPPLYSFHLDIYVVKTNYWLILIERRTYRRWVA